MLIRTKQFKCFVFNIIVCYKRTEFNRLVFAGIVGTVEN